MGRSRGRTQGWGRPARTLAALVLAAALNAAGAQAAPEPQAYRANDAGGFRNILPSGQNGHASAADLLAFEATKARPPHNSDQLKPYADLVQASPSLQAGDLSTYFKDASFGVRDGDVEERYSPRDDVTVLRDKGYGVPHIYGSTRAGTMFGAGYVGAEDRLFFMDVLRHVGRARLSSFVGGSQSNRQMDREQWAAAPYTEEDFQRQFDRLDDLYGDDGRVIQNDLSNYVEGINRYIAEATGTATPTEGAKNGPTPVQKLPGEYAAITPNGDGGVGRPEPWKVTDLIATASLVGGIFGKGGGRELDSSLVLLAARAQFGADGRKVFDDFRNAEDPEAPTTIDQPFPYEAPPEHPAAESLAVPDDGTVVKTDVVRSAGRRGRRGGIFGKGAVFPEGASNSLVVSGAESESGRPVAVFGPQVGYFAPQILQELEMHAPASAAGPAIDARGASFPGVNLYIQLGRGRDYAWSATSAGQDIVDTFALDLCEPGGGTPSLDSTHYRYRGQCKPFETLTRTNQWVPNAADSSLPGTETLQANRTELGIETARGKVGGTPVVYTQLRSTYQHELDSARGFLDFNTPDRMESPAEFQKAASRIGFTFNWFFANRKDIAYFNSGDNPQRADGTDPNFPVRACPTDACAFQWRNWDPATFVASYTPFEQHPQAINPPYMTSWNNKQAPGYRAADENYSYGSIFRSQSLDDALKPRIAGGEKITPAELTDAMADAATVDLRGRQVLPFLLRVIGDPADPSLTGPIAELADWQHDGAHRRDRDGNGTYEHSDAVKIMDAWWPRLVPDEFRPALGSALYDRILSMIELDNTPNGDGAHLGSAYIAGWYSYVQKDLRQLLGDEVKGPHSRVYCGDGDRSACREALLTSLRAAVAADRAATYTDETCAKDENRQLDDQLCFDSIEQSAIGAITQPLINWQNRPTFQQVVELDAAPTPTPTPSAAAAPAASATPAAKQRKRRQQGASAPRSAAAPQSAARPASGGALPFTGLELGAIAAAGAALALGGATLRRRLGRRGEA